MTISDPVLVSPLSDRPVCGIRLFNAVMLRLDQYHCAAPGNKFFKLQNNLRDLAEGEAVVSFGGAWSNHLHALAAMGAELNFPTVGIVRGQRAETLSATLRDCESLGMKLHFVSREEYRHKHEPNFLEALQRRFAPCRVIPEGGGNMLGVRGSGEIIGLIDRCIGDYQTIALACGTGTTMAGLSLSLPPGKHLLGVSALKNGGQQELIRRYTERENWQLCEAYHAGGYAKVHADLKAFILEFEKVQGIALDPIYTGKLMWGLYQMQAAGELMCDSPLVVIHSGGLQGRRGFEWLSYDDSRMELSK